MPYTVKLRNGKYRLIDQDGKVAKNKAGTAIDGGGAVNKSTVQRQARAIMANENQ